MSKKHLCILFIFPLVFMLGACSLPETCDWSELVGRADKYAKSTEISIEESFFSDGKWFLYLSLSDENDIIVTAEENDDRKIISLSLSTLNMENEGQTDAFRRASEYFVRAFTGEEIYDELLREVRLYEDEAVFSEDTYFYESGRYKISFFNADIGCSIICERLY